jgi:sugar phosphate isomerase/epimerase
VNLAVSNIAWAPAERLDAYNLMETAGLTGLEIAPGLFFSAADDPFAPDDATEIAAMAEIGARGLSLVSMQSLLFGVHSASLFGDKEELAAFENGMNRAIDLAGRLGIPNLVFGSPLQRRFPDGMAPNDAFARAAEVFHRLGERAISAGTIIAVEPNPAAYGTNFLNTLEEAEHFIIQVAHPAIALNLDLGAMHMNGTFATVVGRVGTLLPFLAHVHVSEPKLAPAPADTTELEPVLSALRAKGYTRAVSIEMKREHDALMILRSRIAALVRASGAGLR